MPRVALIAVLALACSACNRHDVPLGGACSRGEDCDTSALTCLVAAGQSKGICSKPCSIPPPGTSITPGGVTCEQKGLVCRKAASPHPILGEAYCVQP
jgi:hypothetical protein